VEVDERFPRLSAQTARDRGCQRSVRRQPGGVRLAVTVQGVLDLPERQRSASRLCRCRPGGRCRRRPARERAYLADVLAEEAEDLLTALRHVGSGDLRDQALVFVPGRDDVLGET